uniref:Tannase n=1 Tax=Diospyros kaki TaxID=35925 RepID=A0A5B9G695_DIOKA|nr:tannase [Diospyros kaki]
MESPAGEIALEFPPFFRVYKDGRLKRFQLSDYVPPGVDPATGVQFKDVVISPETGLKARLFLPKISGSDQRLPLVVHFHGGGFCIGSALGNINLKYLTSLASEARCIAVSVEYRLAPEHPLPIAYDDSFSGLQWVATHSTGQGPDPWLNRYADFGRVFLAGESAGANLAHHVAVRAGATGLGGVRLLGLVVAHPFFAGKEPDKMMQYLYPGSSASDDDPKLSPNADPDLGKMGCSRVLACVAEKDWLKPRGVAYCETLKKSSWKGTVELIESEGEDHCFHLFNPDCEKAEALMQKLVSFINQD